MSAATTVPATMTTTQRVASDFADYLQRQAGALEQLSAKQRRRLRQLIRRAVR